MRKRLFSCYLSLLIVLAMFTISFAEFVKGPYLQNVTQNSIIISWQSSTPTAGTVYYGVGDTSLSMSDANISTFHEVLLTELNSETEYMYRVEAGFDISQINTFLTAVTDSTSFRFAAHGDNRPGNTANHLAVVNLIKSFSPAFIINVGDLWKTNADSDVQTFFDIEKELIKNTTLFPARGNHENVNLDGEPDRFRYYFNLPVNLTSDDGYAYYSFNYGNSHFLFINTSIDYSNGSNQYIQIVNDLNATVADNKIKHIFVVMHHPAHSNGDAHGGDENPSLSSVLGPLFVKYNVDIVFQGHDHDYERFQPEGSSGPLGDPAGDPDNISDGVTYVVTGGGGAPLHNVPSAPHTEVGVTPNLTSQVSISSFQAMQIDVSGDTVHVTVLGVDSTKLDEFIINKRSKSRPSPYLYPLLLE